MRCLCKIWTRVSTVLVAGVVLAMMAGAGPAHANGAGAGIVGSPHDFSAETWNFRGEICRVCHVPHDHQRAAQLYLNGLLWNHQVSAATYTMYDASWSSSLDGAQSGQPDGIAKMCLGCHDGTVAIDQFDKNLNDDATGTDGVPNFPLITDINVDFLVPGFADGSNLDLRGTHPLSIAYDPVADTNLNVVTNTMGTSGTIADVLDAGKVQCSSCHDVHDQESVPGTHLLRVAQSIAQGGVASGLCLTCHIK